jgi:hypothetical protein
MTDINQFLQLVDAYSQATGLAQSTISTRLFNDGKRLEMLRDGRDVGIRKVTEAVQLMSDSWPPESVWPLGVPRPAPAAMRADT